MFKVLIIISYLFYLILNRKSVINQKCLNNNDNNIHNNYITITYYAND